MAPTKDQLQRDLDQERQRALHLILRELSKRVASVNTQVTALSTQVTAIKTAEQSRLDLEKQRTMRRVLDGFLAADWKGKVAYLSPVFALLILGYALAADQPPAIVATDLLRAIGLCATGAPNAHDPANESTSHPTEARPSGGDPGPDPDASDNPGD
jgi:hypothetical protein